MFGASNFSFINSNSMESSKLRKAFLDFFAQQGHKIVPSSSLVPQDDPSVLLTPAGVQQFKPYFAGNKDVLADFGSKRLVSIQKSFRTTDIDEVGDREHLTFFEMLGNFSIGDYFKEQAIQFADRFVRQVLGIPKERIHLTVFAGDKEVPKDQESLAIWQSLGFEKGRIRQAGREDNFWGPTGQEGPCGPTTEIYVDGVEIWNLVFNEYYCQPDGTLVDLNQAGGQKGVDTGLGLERTVLVLQQVGSVFETDLFVPLMEALDKSSRRSDDSSQRGKRIIADHLRACAFLIADGVRPSNQKQGYILRRLIRRLYRYSRELGIEKLSTMFDIIIQQYQTFYPELREHRAKIIEVFNDEVNKFDKVLIRGMNKFKSIIKNYNKIIPGKEAFFLYESYGFPLEFTQELAREHNLQIDLAGFEREKQKHREVSRQKGLSGG